MTGEPQPVPPAAPVPDVAPAPVPPVGPVAVYTADVAPLPQNRPSPYRLPQHCTPDRRRARAATLRLQRAQYALISDPDVVYDREVYRLPPHVAVLPPGERFSTVKKAWYYGHKGQAAANLAAAMALNPSKQMSSPRDYARLLVAISGPAVPMARWRTDEEFARQRLSGTNPVEIRAWDPAEDRGLADAVGATLRHFGLPSTMEMKGRLFCSDYTELASPLIQESVKPGLRLAAPVAVFFARDGGLSPAAIRLDPDGEIVTPLHPNPARWLFARCHVEVADGHRHEGVRHLLETHLVVEVFATCTARHLHPDHPLAQLLGPHFTFNLAIDDLARGDLLSVGGPIDVAVSAGVTGVVNLARWHWSRWRFDRRGPLEDLAERGVTDGEILSQYHFRDDAVAIFEAIQHWLVDLLPVWYGTDEDVLADFELQAWADEVGANLPGFPAIKSRATLREVLAQVIYRASAGHAAVNNGQYDKYSWVPNSPAAMRAEKVPGADLSTGELWRLMPPFNCSVAQLSMAWILSTPTIRSIIDAGNVPAFDRDLHPAAAEAVGAFRRRLRQISEHIQLRNVAIEEAGGVPYAWLDPIRVSCSIDT